MRRHDDHAGKEPFFSLIDTMLLQLFNPLKNKLNNDPSTSVSSVCVMEKKQRVCARVCNMQRYQKGPINTPAI